MTYMKHFVSYFFMESTSYILHSIQNYTVAHIANITYITMCDPSEILHHCKTRFSRVRIMFYISTIWETMFNAT